ncbi:En/Spm-like transposon protein [Cucumis melo var. makuwa]|uniref:En/Spm-like transposon protein n=1 Tax=Cucumis melo var. makuwa TaxID=1194695 RepID=A0A5A7T186_CUCMM|nr:En/Spm-like transposon protein [Cucumis melo var. makuwa]
MCHPVDSVSWDSIDAKWPDFSNDLRNLKFGFATDGFNPFSNLSSRYSCWPVMLVTYNLPSWLCMSKENIMLTLLIPGPKQPGNDIDIFLQQLIDDLKLLWDGVEVYDVVSKSNFNLKVVLMWTINDFPTYGNLAGCTTKGREVRLCGPIQFHWMYPFERYMKTLKGFVRNQSRSEGCIVEHYLAEECILFYKNCVQGSTRLDDKQRRNEEFNDDIILEGRPIFNRKKITLSDEVLNLAHQYVLFNIKAVEPYIENELILSNKILANDDTQVMKVHSEQFPIWLKEKRKQRSLWLATVTFGRSPACPCPYLCPYLKMRNGKSEHKILSKGPTTSPASLVVNVHNQECMQSLISTRRTSSRISYLEISSVETTAKPHFSSGSHACKAARASAACVRLSYDISEGAVRRGSCGRGSSRLHAEKKTRVRGSSSGSKARHGCSGREHESAVVAGLHAFCSGLLNWGRRRCLAVRRNLTVAVRLSPPNREETCNTYHTELQTVPCQWWPDNYCYKRTPSNANGSPNSLKTLAHRLGACPPKSGSTSLFNHQSEDEKLC